MADLADPDADLAVRRRVLSDRASCPGGCRRRRALLPPSYVFEGMRAVVAGQARALGPPGDRRRRSASSTSSLACLFFSAVYRYAIRTGLIARYSAETVS